MISTCIPVSDSFNILTWAPEINSTAVEVRNWFGLVLNITTNTHRKMMREIGTSAKLLKTFFFYNSAGGRCRIDSLEDLGYSQSAAEAQNVFPSSFCLRSHLKETGHFFSCLHQCILFNLCGPVSKEHRSQNTLGWGGTSTAGSHSFSGQIAQPAKSK